LNSAPPQAPQRKAPRTRPAACRNG
jgi:hypothetical protein